MAEGQWRREPAADREPQTVRAIAVTPFSELKANSGRLVKPDANGIFWLTEHEAQGIRFNRMMRILENGE